MIAALPKRTLDFEALGARRCGHQRDPAVCDCEDRAGVRRGGRRNAEGIVSRDRASVMKSIRISERHSHLVFGLIQSAITCAIAAGIASIPFMETGSFAVHWAKAWAISWVSMLPVVILAAPFIRALVDRFVRDSKPSDCP
jgi:hypothetical protein